MRNGTVELALLLACISSSCSSLTTSWQYDHDSDLVGLRRYQWIGVRAARNHLVENRVRETTDRTLASRGLTLAAADPDFCVVVYFDPEEEARLQATLVDSPSGLGILVGVLLERWANGCHMLLMDDWVDLASDTQTLRLEFTDPKTQRVLWRGRATGPFDARMREDQQIALVDRSVAELLAGFPPNR